jgi:hypothetical protein
MKIYPNLAGGLRFYFGLARALIIVFAAFWLSTLTFGPAIRKFFGPGSGLMVTVGEASIPPSATLVGLNSDCAKAGSLALAGLRGSLQVDLLSDDAALVSTLRWTIIPFIAVLVAFTWQLFGSLRAVCTNIGKREAFSEENLRLVRNIGWMLIGYSLAVFAVQLLATYTMGGYLAQHVTMIDLKTGLPLPAGAGPVRLSFPGGQFPGEFGLVAGCLVLLLSEAFRQGLVLKTENDLTV